MVAALFLFLCAFFIWCRQRISARISRLANSAAAEKPATRKATALQEAAQQLHRRRSGHSAGVPVSSSGKKHFIGCERFARDVAEHGSASPVPNEWLEQFTCDRDADVLIRTPMAMASPISMSGNSQKSNVENFAP